MELRQLQYFVKVAKMQHVTHASEELHVAQSAVSRQIHQLEEELGVSLFAQKGRNLQLTQVGKLFLSRVENVLNDLDKAVQEVHELLDPESGEVRLGFPHSVGLNLLPCVVADFKKKHSKARFRFKQGKYNSLIHAVANGEVDLAIISPCPEKHDDVTGEVLLTEELFAILPASHPFAGRKSIKLKELEHETFVLFSEGYSLRPIVWEACLRAGFVPKIGFEGEETDTIKGLVAAGMGVSLLPEMALTGVSELQPVKMKIEEPPVTRTIGLIRRSGSKLSPVADTFREFVLNYFNYPEKSLSLKNNST
ncbi:LysR family transcriptional regulator [Ferviditalea candida]|uniref:LysR family transcriptional regulator n=1 Tax=Ferviditalea candida TaxID=3108399 RepID=A0ABU5ZG01_9BACL|nr:LysR family transcriptional regulator [Paenibacillaceae bacterium T2]